MSKRNSNCKVLEEHRARPDNVQGVPMQAGRAFVQLPSIEGLLKGLPWPPAARHISLPQTPYSPASTSGGSTSWRESILQKSPPNPPEIDRDEVHKGRKPSSIERLQVPKMLLRESGGWVDTSHWLFMQVHAEFGTCSIEELMLAGFRRNARPIYGENHFSTRGKSSDDLDESEEDSPLASSPRNNHRTKERDRRVRHQVLQRENDETTPTALFEMAERTLPSVKDTIKAMSRREKEKQKLMAQQNGEPRAKTASAKNTGKDEQLLAAALFPHFCALLIIRLNQARLETEETIVRLQQENAALRHSQHLGAYETVFTPSSTSDCWSNTRRSSSASSVLPPCQELLQPQFAIGKRARADGENLAMMAPLRDSSERSGGYEGHKRRRFSPETMRRRLPPSPTPSVDEDSTSFSE